MKNKLPGWELDVKADKFLLKVSIFGKPKKKFKNKSFNFTLEEKFTSWQTFRERHFCASSIIATLRSFK
jgi:hypothetical protein